MAKDIGSVDLCLLISAGCPDLEPSCTFSLSGDEICRRQVFSMSFSLRLITLAFTSVICLVMRSDDIYIGLICMASHFYAPAYSVNSGRALSVTPVHPVCSSLFPSVQLCVRAITPKPYGIYS